MLLAASLLRVGVACGATAFRLVDVSCGVFKHAGTLPRKPRTFRATPMSEPGDNLRRLTGLYRTMARIRAFEETALEAHKAGEIPGPLHVSIGQEAVAAGICVNLRTDDRITSNHRGHGHAIAKGADPRRMMAELYGRADGYCRGKGGSMHIADFSVGMLGANGVVAGGIPIAVGAAQGLKMQKSDAIVTCMFGDGAINRGPFLEGLNWAVLYKLPVLFVCEDNGVAAFTRSESVTAGPGVIDRAKALGVAAITVDGNNVMSVDDAAQSAVAAVRRGDGPHLLHVRTYRITGHTSTDAAAWRPAEEVQEARSRDPIARLGAVLAGRGVGPSDLGKIIDAAKAEMAAARKDANAAAWPQAHVAYEDVQDTGAVAWSKSH
jgi:pyruvate dehydrogenase E1 component alpha subunit